MSASETFTGVADRPAAESYRASPQQERLWKLVRADGGDALRVRGRLVVEGDVEPAGLAAAWKRLVAKHELLRTRLELLPGLARPVQTVDEDRTRWLDPAPDLGELEPMAREARLDALEDELAHRPEAATHLLVRPVSAGAGRQILVLAGPAHLSDASGLGVLARALADAYADRRAPIDAVDAEDAEDDGPLQYAAVADWLLETLESEEAEVGRELWAAFDLDRLDERRLPLAAPAGEAPFLPRTVAVDLAPEVASRLGALAHHLDRSTEAVLATAWLVLLARVTGDDPVVGVALDPRRDEELADVLGPLERYVPVTVDASPRRPFDELVGSLAHRLDEAYEWQECFAWGASGDGWFPFTFALRRFPEPVEVAGARFHLARGEARIDRFELELSGRESRRGIALDLVYDASRIDRREVERMADRLAVLLAGVVAEPGAELGHLPVLGEAERRHLVEERNDTAAPWSLDRCLDELVVEGLERRPDHPILIAGDEVVSAGDLDRRSRRLARRLVAVGVGPEVVVGVAVERSIEMVVALLAVLRSGGAYLPLDPTYPVERLRGIIEDAAPRLVLVAGAERPAAVPEAVAVLAVGADGADDDGGVELPAPSRRHPDQLAYVIFTSGSTGRPKGVMIRHRSIVNRLLWTLDELPLAADDRLLQKTPFGFDASVWELFAPLLAGATLVLAPPDAHRDTGALVATAARHEVTVLQAVPSLWAALVEEPELPRCTSLRLLFSGGEALSARLAERLVETTGARLVNLYGPTETAIDATWHGWRGEGSGVVPIGRPLANLRVYLLDARGRLVVEGATGELTVAGVGLARGYLGRPGWTAERFVPSPVPAEPGERLYRTGDLARVGRSGALEVVGRLDDQVKVRGVRVELGEVEAVLGGHPQVREAVAAVIAGELVAYLVTAGADDPEIPSRVRVWAGERLQEQMVPSRLLVLDVLPRTPSGKLDRRALPDPAELSPERREVTSPTTPTEDLLVGVWADLLETWPVGVADNFFELGGHSLLATRLVTELRRLFEVEVAIRTVFDHPRLDDLAAEIDRLVREGHRIEAPPLVPVDRDRRFPLSFPQQRLWFLEQLEPGNPAYHIATGVRITGALDPLVLWRSAGRLVARHESLRTRFVTVDGEPEQQVAPVGGSSLPVIDLAALPAVVRERELARQASANARRPFDLVAGPPLRLRLVSLGSDEWALLLAFHHLVSDGLSMGIFVRELTALYRALTTGGEPDLPELPIQYADYAAWQRDWLQGEALERQLDYWRARLGSGDPVLELPTDRPRPQMQTYVGAARSVRLPAALAERLRALGHRHGATQFMIVAAAFQALLHRLTRQTSISLGTPVAGRHWGEVAGLVGLFVNTLVLRGEIDGERGFSQLLAQVREAALGAYAHQDVPFEIVVEAVDPERDLAHSPLFQVMLTFATEPARPKPLEGLSLGGVDLDLGTVQFDLELAVAERSDGLDLTLAYARRLFDPTTAIRVLRHLARLLDAAAREPETPVGLLPMLSPAERHQLVVEWNDRRPRAGVETFPGWWAAQVSATPERVAVVEGDVRLTYGELAERVRRAAAVLGAAGVGRGDLVALLVERSLGFWVAVLALLELGAAYLPLDPRQPSRKLAQVLDAGTPRWVVVGAALGRLLDEAFDRLAEAPQVLGLEDLDSTQVPALAPSGDGPAPEELAYVLFTSGSTGVPKGAMVEHRGMVNHLAAKIEDLGLGPEDVVAQTAPQTFDISVWQFLAGLLVGARTVIVPPEVVADPRRLIEICADHRVSVLEVVPSLLRGLLDALDQDPAAERLSSLRWMIPTGEALPPDLCRRWLARYPEVPLLNAYGPTECSDDVSHHRIDQPPVADAVRVPIGRPVRGFRLVVVDRQLGPVPLGAAGELLVSGVGVGRGYLDDPARTAETFVPDPRGGGDRAYRTGDLVRPLTDGALDFLGRIDHQVKLRGFRIELGEVEVATRSLDGVREAVAVVDDSGADRRLVVYLSPEGDGDPNGETVRAHLAERLPEYMVPGVVVVLDELPLSPNGKIDRRALPAPSPDDEGAGRWVEPRTPFEGRLRQVWERVLERSPIGVEDDFFRLGGHSLLAVRLVAAIDRDLGIDLPLAALFQAPTIAALARRLEADDLEGSPLVEIQPGAPDRPALFLVHPVGGTVLAYQPLARALGDEQPVWGIQDPWLESLGDGGDGGDGGEGGEVPRPSVEEMAGEYVAALRTARPSGPYLLGGWSFGGLVAFEMARQLAASGLTPTVLAVIDARPVAHEPPEETDLDLLTGIARDLARRAGRDLALADEEIEAVDPETRVDHVLGELQRAGLVPPELGRERVSRYLARRRSNERAAYEYRPGSYPGEITYFRATEADPLVDGGGDGTTDTDDPTGGWAGLSTHPVRVLDVPGYHAGLVFDPYVQVLAEQLAVRIQTEGKG